MVEKGRIKLIPLIICIIIWYSVFIQERFIQINGFLPLLGIILIILVFFDIRGQIQKFFTMLPLPIKILLLYFILMLVFGLLVSPNVSAHWDQWLTSFEYFLVMACVTYYCIKRKNLTFLVWNFAIMYTLMTIIFIVSPVYYHGIEAGERLTFAINMNPNGFAMGLTTGIWAITYLVSLKKINFFIGMPLCGLSLYAIFLTGSRKGFFAAIICLVLWVVLCYIPVGTRKHSLKRLGRIMLVVGVVVVLFAILVPYYNDSVIAGRMINIVEDNRVDLYVKGWEYFTQSPVFGYGFRGFSTLYGNPAYYSHSTIIEVLVSGGAVLAAVYFFTYFVIGKNLIKRMIADNRSDAVPEQKTQIRQHFILFCILAFYTVSVIHFYQLDSSILFGMVIASYSFVVTGKNEIKET